MSRSPIRVAVRDMMLNVFRVGATPLVKSSDGSIDYNRIKSTHTHFTYEIFFITSGKMKLVTNDYISEYKNSVLIIPPKIKHFSVPIGGETFCLLFSFEKNAKFEEQLNQDVFELPITDEISFYIKKFTEKSNLNTPYAEEDAKYLAALIFNNVFLSIKSAKNNPQNSKKHTPRHINAIEAYINDNRGNKFTLEDVARNVYLSPKQVSRIIKKEYGCTFSALVLEKRLAVAEIMLKNTDMKISDIATQTFYGTENYFYNVFKAKYGMSPLKFRKEARILENKKT